MLGDRIKMLREEKKLKQDELAKIINVSSSTIGMYEINKREPNNEITLKLATFFGVSTDYLLGNSDIRNPEKATFMAPTEIQSYYDELNEAGKQKAIENIKDLTKIQEYTEKKEKF